MHVVIRPLEAAEVTEVVAHSPANRLAQQGQRHSSRRYLAEQEDGARVTLSPFLTARSRAT
jgi:hypothetical protein